MENPIAVANFFVNKSLYEGIELTPMKLLKLVYLAHGWNLGLKNEPLLAEAVQAWKYGPVVQTVYDAFKRYKGSQIDGLYFDVQTMSYVVPKDAYANALLNKIWEVYKDYTGLELSTLTHEEGSPWDTVYNKEGGKSKPFSIIRNDLIADYYSKKADHQLHHV
jgi:uncharacterized phage-associated protein